jgi:hypothetical protein
MKTIKYSLLILLIVPCFLYAQNKGIAFGSVKKSDFAHQSPLVDEETSAIVLYEFGDYFFDFEESGDLQIEYHVIIKILKTDGLEKANVSIPLYTNEKGSKETIVWLSAASYTLVNGEIKKQNVEKKNIYIEDPALFRQDYKFPIPGVVVGSIIEYKYRLKTPFFNNLKTWYFQGDIPKVKSEFHAKIPGNYIYNVTLRGFLKLTTDFTDVDDDCVVISEGGYGQKTAASCAIMRYGIENVPAFKEEAYITSRENFLSSLRFELAQINHFSGKKDVITKTWKAVDEELRNYKDFGGELKRGEKFFKDANVLPVVKEDTLKQIQQTYLFIRNYYSWNDVFSMYAYIGIEKSFEKKSGSVGDINLALVAALRSQKIKADPLILRTRASGVVTDLHPVLSDFNYVIARVESQGKVYLLDASYQNAFPLLPIRCLNGKGRVIPYKGESYWEDLKPAGKFKTSNSFNFTLAENTDVIVDVINRYEGYESVSKRSQRNDFTDVADYKNYLFKNLPDLEVLSFDERDQNDYLLPYSNFYKLKLSLQAQSDNVVYINPFMLDTEWQNPFTLKERNYPVDYGAPIEETKIISFQFPEIFVVESLPKSMGKSLPGNGGKVLYDCQAQGNKVNITFKFQINKTLFSPEEYYYLKEFYNTVLDLRNTPIVLKRKQ